MGYHQPRGYDVLNDKSVSKSTAHTLAERERYGLRGLLPHAVSTQDVQISRVLENLRRKESNIERYIFLTALQDRNERLFYRTVIEHIDEIMPLIYTPTVGEACSQFAHIFRQARGFYVTPDDKGHIRRMLDNWPDPEVRVIVITDGQRILGLGDLGANGMGIPIGKLSLYVACAGIHPNGCMPIMFDVGTDNESLIKDPLYLGYRHKRIEGDHYLELMEELIAAVQDKFPDALIQFEDFLTPNAYRLLTEYRDRVLCFNDDIQGTAAVTLAGIYASTRITKLDFKDLRIMFLGAGSAATGIGDLLLEAFKKAGVSEVEARKRLWFVDINGLLVSSRTDLMAHNIPYAHHHTQMSFIDAIKDIKPQVLIGATGAPNTFTREVVETMSQINERPTIFALSNPTSRAECTAEQAYQWSEGRAVFASGSPFDAVKHDGNTLRPGQGNNAYIFPGIGLGVTNCQASRISEDMFMAAAETLAQQVDEGLLKTATLYPPLRDIRKVSLAIAESVAEVAYKQGLAKMERPADLRGTIERSMYDPKY